MKYFIAVTIIQKNAIIIYEYIMIALRSYENVGLCSLD